MRHETASLMGAAEEDPHLIKQVLGRSRAGTTIDTPLGRVPQDPPASGQRLRHRKLAALTGKLTRYPVVDPLRPSDERWA
jgi:hypothetical protein